MSENLALGFLFERTTRIIKLRFHQLFKEHNANITPEQWVVLDILHQKGILAQKEIAQHSFKDAPSISRILDGLYKRKLVQKATGKEDKRSVFICLTDDGEVLVEKLQPHVDKLRNIGVEDIPLEDISQLTGMINKIFNNYSDD